MCSRVLRESANAVIQGIVIRVNPVQISGTNLRSFLMPFPFTAISFDSEDPIPT
jgi:hypothetical protein